MHNDHSHVRDEIIQNNQIYDLIDHMMDYYDGLWHTSYYFIPHGTMTIGNYASYIFLSIRATLDSIRLLLREGHITDAFVLIRKLFDTVLVEIYLNVVREDKYDWMKSLVVEDLDEWMKSNYWIPRTDKILKVLKDSKTTRDLYPWFGWDTYLKTNRTHLDNHVHASSYYSILLNCPQICLQDREKQLKNASIILKQIILVHISFTFFMNGQYMLASDYMEYRDMNMIPPEGSECWLAPYAQRAFDEFLKPHEKLAAFIKERCCMTIE